MKSGQERDRGIGRGCLLEKGSEVDMIKTWNVCMKFSNNEKDNPRSILFSLHEYIRNHRAKSHLVPEELEPNNSLSTLL